MSKNTTKLILFTLIFYLFLNLAGFLFDQPSKAGPLEDDQEDFFPLNEGQTWKYRGNIRWTNPDSNIISEKDINLETKVIHSVQSDNQEIAIISGFPSNLIWTDPDTNFEKEYTLIIRKSDSYYIVHNPAVDDWIYNDHQQLDLETQASKLLSNPIADNQIVENPDRLNRYIKMTPAYDLDKLANYTRSYIKPSYKIDLSTISDQEIIYFSPTIGITQYKYQHHGTIMEVSLELVEIQH